METNKDVQSQKKKQGNLAEKFDRYNYVCYYAARKNMINGNSFGSK
jgi:hypothetical protein